MIQKRREVEDLIGQAVRHLLQVGRTDSASKQCEIDDEKSRIRDLEGRVSFLEDRLERVQHEVVFTLLYAFIHKVEEERSQNDALSKKVRSVQHLVEDYKGRFF